MLFVPGYSVEPRLAILTHFGRDGRIQRGSVFKYHGPVSDSSKSIQCSAQVPAELAGIRLDQIAAKLFPEYSRSRLQEWIKSGQLLVDGQKKRPRDTVGEAAIIKIDAELAAAESWTAEALPLDIVYEDEHLLVINKASNVVVHPAAGHRDGTLLNGLLQHCGQLEALPRAGIVHRLDKDTTGLMVVAKTLIAHKSLVDQLQQRSVSREYEAVVKGVLTGGGTVDAKLGRHPVNRKKRAVLENGQEAVSRYRVLERFRAHTHVQVNLETGRTHQIRVHMAHINYPLVGDPLYGGRMQLPRAASPMLTSMLKDFRRQALHARRLKLIHPARREEIVWEIAQPKDFTNLLNVLREDQVEVGN